MTPHDPSVITHQPTRLAPQKPGWDARTKRLVALWLPALILADGAFALFGIGYFLGALRDSELNGGASSLAVPDWAMTLAIIAVPASMVIGFVVMNGLGRHVDAGTTVAIRFLALSIVALATFPISVQLWNILGLGSRNVDYVPGTSWSTDLWNTLHSWGPIVLIMIIAILSGIAFARISAPIMRERRAARVALTGIEMLGTVTEVTMLGSRRNFETRQPELWLVRVNVVFRDKKDRERTVQQIGWVNEEFSAPTSVLVKYDPTLLDDPYSVVLGLPWVASEDRPRPDVGATQKQK